MGMKLFSIPRTYFCVRPQMPQPGFFRYKFSYHLMPQPGIELMAAKLHLLEGPLKDAQLTELHCRG